MDHDDLRLLARIGIIGLFIGCVVITVSGLFGLAWRVFWMLAGG